jgi:hypothetical protein
MPGSAGRADAVEFFREVKGAALARATFRARMHLVHPVHQPSLKARTDAGGCDPGIGVSTPDGACRPETTKPAPLSVQAPKTATGLSSVSGAGRRRPRILLARRPETAKTRKSLPKPGAVVYSTSRVRRHWRHMHRGAGEEIGTSEPAPPCLIIKSACLH